jgi:hypothetical protein
MTRKEWMAYIEKTWDAAQKEAWANQQPTKIFGPGLEEILNKAGFYRKREWVGLTDEELKPLCDENHIMFGAYTVDFIQAIEAKLKEKNHG